jgi:hypothetical protein
MARPSSNRANKALLSVAASLPLGILTGSLKFKPIVQAEALGACAAAGQNVIELA